MEFGLLCSPVTCVSLLCSCVVGVLWSPSVWLSLIEGPLLFDAVVTALSKSGHNTAGVDVTNGLRVVMIDAMDVVVGIVVIAVVVVDCRGVSLSPE